MCLCVVFLFVCSRLFGRALEDYLALQKMTEPGLRIPSFVVSCLLSLVLLFLLLLLLFVFLMY